MSRVMFYQRQYTILHVLVVTLINLIGFIRHSVLAQWTHGCTDEASPLPHSLLRWLIMVYQRWYDLNQIICINPTPIINFNLIKIKHSLVFFPFICFELFNRFEIPLIEILYNYKKKHGKSINWYSINLVFLFAMVCTFVCTRFAAIPVTIHPNFEKKILSVNKYLENKTQAQLCCVSLGIY